MFFMNPHCHAGILVDADRKVDYAEIGTRE